jgi:quinolinate synthase
MERVYAALKEEKHRVTVPKPVAEKARKALERMFEIT